MPEPTKAVFLSYAREDADAARRIADALRSHGVEVWFDQSELRGGDAWDAKIRRQIKECALFLPIISAKTQERGEGYFRLEWKLAVERTHLMAEGVPFLAPVSIDDTSDSGALVPAEFNRVQWSRLPGGLPTPAFVEQVKHLLQNPRRATTEPFRPTPVAGAPDAPPARTPFPVAWVVAVAAVVVGAGVLWWKRPAEPAMVANPAAAKAKPAAPVPADDKSIAVLPFTNMSEDKDSGFFADGIHEDILTNLALVRNFRVVSRTSVMPYRTTSKSMRQIAQELGVTYILEGSVRRAGNKVRVTGQLIHARTDEHVWAQAYDRDMSDVFAIQAELSQQIAAALKTALSPEEKILIASKPTNNPQAYDLFLRAREVNNREGNNLTALFTRESLLLKAVDLDPAYAGAWGELADVEALFSFWNHDQSEDRKAKAKEAIDRAVALAPNQPDVIQALGTYFYYGHRDYAAALAQFEILSRLTPNDPSVLESLGLIRRRQGRWPEALADLRRAAQLDPGNPNYSRNYAEILQMGRRYDEYAVEQARKAALLPERIEEAFAAAEASFLARGSTREGDAFFAGLAPDRANSPRCVELRKLWARDKGDLAEAIRLDRLQPYFDEDGDAHYIQARFAAEVYFAAGDVAGARARCENFPAEVRARLEREPQNQWLLVNSAAFATFFGDTAKAQAYAEKAMTLLPESVDAVDGQVSRIVLAVTYARTGAKEKALEQLAILVKTPNQFFNVHAARMGHFFGPLEGDPRFEAIMNDPKNNAPLF